MKLIDALKHSGRPFEIPDASRNDFPEFFIEMGFKTGAEIGVKTGDFSEIICRTGLKLYGIDPYIIYDDYVEPETQKSLNRAMKKAADRLKAYDFTAIKKTSMGALHDFPDESLDFVYIDGNHSFKFVAEDIFEWSKKVKKGGIIAGHDYVYLGSRDRHHVHTKYVVEAYTRAFGIQKWYVIGRKEKVKGEKRDPYRSWFWIKN
ncbi:hypothetical protein A3F00_00680 [Candidatus Daviesbacteria bacterium RIFCSPHIGHO2_12_FULL_37_11]|uniref:Class I SAM-dependent methyltransferase n=1 Tax=Candidatus Daviesbacteria bacterium RIFCSPHIGHO2_12_FULL_37_11 TaxID=1797777 RepID=A0A1F5KCV7_9BACT|nr:MAG: hypothetical protein A2111_03050 [Candidatus Daviesbacteria bacterium GWA1_38_6]OGE17888.1 MAG: hypothetical protein A2769_00405 [Candidatus Daviesbacteria bacterium RIFCSPHIGHO2_01_FULL_37_27]OGE38782.1 MAG: hypothetical protein A3F00_00680 [Candidatus Daviesbacteria bacterium RIFCSPHIGHO2_12_FULL_37_11]